jgi:hypothetical protein
MGYDPQVASFPREPGSIRGRVGGNAGGIVNGANSAETLGQIQQRNRLRGTAGTLTLTQALVGVRAGAAGPFRSSIMIISDQPIWIAPKQDQVQSGTGAWIPAGVGITITHGDEVWVAAAQGNSFPQLIAVLTEDLSP